MPRRIKGEWTFPAPGLIRAARRRADFSQIELARAAGVHASTVGRIEAGRIRPSLELFRQLMEVTGHTVVVIDNDRRVLRPMLDSDDLKDGAERRYPSHLDVIPDPKGGEWWGDIYGLTRPPETFWRDRSSRDAQRKRSQWEVRVAKYRHHPPPPEVF